MPASKTVDSTEPKARLTCCSCSRYHMLQVIIIRAFLNCCSMVAIPVYLRHTISFKDGSSGRLDITVGPKQTMGKTVSNHIHSIFVICFVIIGGTNKLC